ncbi:MAG: hypothetical protein JXL80_08070 [Planctomycetes bacterium]|nr:hypothetical protein [Planctomycetota bacterium]
MSENRTDAVGQSDKVVIRETWLVPVARPSVYAIASDFTRMPENFPKLAHSVKIVSRNGNRLTIEAEAASFGRLFPRVKISIEAELLPERGYRCSTFNRTFNTRGEEELLLDDAPEGTQVQYAYVVTVKRQWLRPLFAWLVRTFGLPYWKKHYLTPLTLRAREHQDALSTSGTGQGEF